MVVQSATIAGCLGNSTALSSSGGSQHDQSNSNAVISPTDVAANNILSLAKRNRTA